jgi:hypothetical protein
MPTSGVPVSTRLRITEKVEEGKRSQNELRKSGRAGVSNTGTP